MIKLVFRLFPRTIWEFSAAGEKDALDKMFDTFADLGSPRMDHPLDAVMLKLRPCKSCREAVRMLRQVREEMRNK